MLPYKNRLKSDFSKLFKGKDKFINPYFIIFYQENGRDFSRFGFVIRKKLGKAVLRNKVKRRFRFVIRDNLDKIESGFDFIFLINHNLSNWKDISYEDIKKNILESLKAINKI